MSGIMIAELSGIDVAEVSGNNASGIRILYMCGMDVADTSGMDVLRLRPDCLPRSSHTENEPPVGLVPRIGSRELNSPLRDTHRKSWMRRRRCNKTIPKYNLPSCVRSVETKEIASETYV